MLLCTRIWSLLPLLILCWLLLMILMLLSLAKMMVITIFLWPPLLPSTLKAPLPNPLMTCCPIWLSWSLMNPLIKLRALGAFLSLIALPSFCLLRKLLFQKFLLPLLQDPLLSLPLVSLIMPSLFLPLPPCASSSVDSRPIPLTITSHSFFKSANKACTHSYNWDSSLFPTTSHFLIPWSELVPIIPEISLMICMALVLGIRLKS